MPEHPDRLAMFACILSGGPDRTIVALDGKSYHFEDHPQFGPSFETREPGVRSPFWPAVTCWIKQGRRICENGFCLWHPEPTEVLVPLWGRNYLVVGQVLQNDRCCLIEERRKAVVVVR